MELQSLAKVLIAMGTLLLIMGVVVYAASMLNVPFGKLPGDIRIEKPGFRLYVPVTTSILVSIVLSLLLYLLSRLR